MAVFREEYKIKGKKVVIRNAEPEDAETMIELVRRFDEESDFLAREPGEFQMTVEAERSYIEKRKNMPNYRFAVAEVNGKIVGSSDAFYHTRRRYRHAGEVAIAIEQAHWGLGLGRAMLEEEIDWLRANGVTKVNLSVDTQNLRAISLYQRLGFVVEGLRRRDRRMADGSYRDAYWMGLCLE